MAPNSGNAFRRRWAVFSEAIASRLWPIPMGAVILGVLLGIAIPELDRAIDEDLPDNVTAILFSGGTEAARAVLSAIAGSLITATSLTFSLTVVALQLASSQASPRLLRMFASDRMVHATLALFLGTFAYALAVLRTVSDADGEPFVPRIAVTVASLLTLASVIMLTFFLAHLARQLRVETMLRDVHEETQRAIRLAAGTPLPAADRAPAAPDTPTRIVPASRSGFITGVDRYAILEIAAEHDLVVRELRTVGSSVIEGSPLLEWWTRAAGAALDPDTRQRVADGLANAVHVGYERTPTQDIGFGLRQLVDIAVRALSPGVNDPTTAVHALSHISAVVAELDRMPPEPPALADDHGEPRLVQAQHEFVDLLELAVEQPRRYGASDPDVAARLYRLLEELAERVRRTERRSAVGAQLERLEASVARVDYDAHERERFARLGRAVRERLAEGGRATDAARTA